MKTKSIISVLLILAGLFIGIAGYGKLSDSTANVELFGLDIDASNKGGQQQGYIMLGFAAIVFGAGVFTLNKKGKP
ncbi:hypothetical protein [Jiulongibacter sediminis]|uniref:Arginyl-tRNA synthetase n=1 Tax=Jiulongibacter sediminis TaxID=1605367 RepID=A0A0N8HAC5_9BACT|nr:hypothetical protein [Jiulongibacter sediminis]KPM49788.1 hypothetical protein AFM12_04230 [Jiulongibacter sediminis]TBX26826.1 hypothetical protein TK44_04235 [Jiulongibacter sediminis]